MQENEVLDVIIVGGSYAGLSAAMTLGRSLRRTVVIDSGKPCNRYTPAAHNFITHDGASPGAISGAAKEQVMAYGTVSFASGLVTECELVDEGFRVGTDTGQAFVAKRVLFATGIKDELLPVPGFEACWGKTIAHCPYCHGYELRGRSTAIISNGDHTAGFYRLIGNWTPDLTLLTNGQADFDRSELPAGVNIVESRITEIIHTNGQVERVLLADGTAQPVGALYYAPPFTQHCPLPERMGCTMLDSGHIETDQFGATSVAGVYAAGDCTTPLRALAVAAARGCVAGSGINHSLVG